MSGSMSAQRKRGGIRSAYDLRWVSCIDGSTVSYAMCGELWTMDPLSRCDLVRTADDGCTRVCHPLISQ